jgi:hypothetical protein
MEEVNLMKIRIATLGLAFIMAFGLMFVGQSDAGLVGAWLFDENSGDVAGDLSGNGNDGMLMGAGWTDGIRGSAVSFHDPDSQFILFNADEDPAKSFILHGDSDATLVMWLRPTEPLRHGSWAWTRGDDGDNDRYNIHNGGGDVFGLDYREDNPNTAHGPPWGDWHVPLTVGEWNHIAVTRVGNEYTLWGGGSPMGSWVDENPVLPTANAWILGSPRGCCPLNGDIDEVGFFDVALSEAQINAVMGGVEALGAVESSGKLATAWAQIKDRD